MCLGVMWRPDTSFTRWRRGPLSVGVHTRTKPQKLPKAHPEPLRQSSVSPNNQPHYGVRTPRSSARKLDRVCHYGKVTPAATHNSRPDAHTSSSRTASPAAHRSLQLFAQTRPLSRRHAPASGYTCAWPAARHGASVQPQPLYRLTPASKPPCRWRRRRRRSAGIRHPKEGPEDVVGCASPIMCARVWSHWTSCPISQASHTTLPCVTPWFSSPPCSSLTTTTFDALFPCVTPSSSTTIPSCPDTALSANNLSCPEPIAFSTVAATVAVAVAGSALRSKRSMATRRGCGRVGRAADMTTIPRVQMDR